jgi:hypothetical protein
MVKEYFYRIFHLLKENNPDLKFIIGGDFHQLKPVCDYKNFNYQDSLILHYVCDNNLVHLTKCRRADKALFEDHLSIINGEDINLDDYKFKSITFRNICWKNSTRKIINHWAMKRYIKQHNVKNYIELARNPNYEQSQKIWLFKNLPLIGCRTKKSIGVINSQDYKVIEFTKDIAKIKNLATEEVIEIKTNEITKYFHPAFCVSCHRYQGSTIKEKYTIWEWALMSRELKYVSHSRGTEKKNKQI